MRQPPTGTITFLFTDIEGSTRLWESSPDAMRLALARHDQLIREAITGNGGYVFKTLGDAFCAAFATAPEALAGALTAQCALVSEPWGTETPLLVRMALHTGSAEERGGDYFGAPLSRAARLIAAGHGGQTLLSLAAQELTRDTLPEGAGLRDLGSASLKDLSRPERVFQLLHPDLPAEFPPLRSLDNPDLRNNLPQQLTSFIGREKELAEIKGRLVKTRLLTLLGAGGSGKTRLSLQAAADLLTGEGDGVWLIELAALSDPGRVPQAVADVLGVKEQAGQTLQQTLVDWLKSKRLLLVLDNCEHLVSACASLVADLLRSCPHVHVLASSRERLGVPGEQTYRVPSLTSPDPTRSETAAALSQYEAVRLFLERAQAVQPSFAVTNGNAPSVAQVCWHLDGIPLAIELAAARVRSLSVEEVNTRLDDRFRLLTGGSRTALPRQQTLRALIDWSYDLLTEQEKTMLGRLSVFAGGWTLAAAEAVCSGEDVAGVEIQDGEVMDLLTSLVDKSLVVYEEETGDESRYRFLETMRQYAGDRLRENGASEAVQGLAANWFLRFAVEADGHLAGPEQAAWLRRLEKEHDNLRASLLWYEHTGQPGSESAASSLRLVGALSRFWAVRGHYSEGRQWLQTALGGAQEREGAEEPEASAARARALFGAGHLAYNQSDYSGTRALYEESLAIFRQLGNQRASATMLDNLGNVAYEQGDYAGAQALYEESLTVQRQLGNQEGIASSVGNLGNVAHQQGDYGAAEALHEECLTIQRQFGDQRGIANSLNNLGNAAHAVGRYEAARTLHEESLTIQRQLGNQRGIANSVTHLGKVAHELGDYAGARALFAEGLTIRRRLEDRQGIAYSLEGLAEVAHGQGRLPRAILLMGAAFSLRERIGSFPPPAEQEITEKQKASVRRVLGEDAFSAAWDAGRAMTLDQAVEYALAEEA